MPHGLLRDAESAPDVAGGRPLCADGLHGEAVRGAQVGVAFGGETGVEPVDQGAKAAEEEQRQLVSGLVSLAIIDNLVYVLLVSMVNHVVYSSRSGPPRLELPCPTT